MSRRTDIRCPISITIIVVVSIIIVVVSIIIVSVSIIIIVVSCLYYIVVSMSLLSFPCSQLLFPPFFSHFCLPFQMAPPNCRHCCYSGVLVDFCESSNPRTGKFREKKKYEQNKKIAHDPNDFQQGIKIKEKIIFKFNSNYHFYTLYHLERPTNSIKSFLPLPGFEPGLKGWEPSVLTVILQRISMEL